jgi:heme-degrading monooxygenase HmoA
VIARIWRGWARPQDAEAYAAHFQGTVLPHLGEIAGYRGARLLRREEGDEVGFVTITFFDSLEAIQAFAGPDPEKAHVEPEGRRALSRIEERCAHYTVVASEDVTPRARA